MDSSQGSVLSSNVAGLVDGSSAQREVSYLDGIPIYVKELIAGGAAGAFAKTTVAPLERIKILLQVKHTKKKKCSHSRNVFIFFLMNIIRYNGSTGLAVSYRYAHMHPMNFGPLNTPGTWVLNL